MFHSQLVPGKLDTKPINDAFAIQLNRIDTRDTRDDNFVQVNHHPALNLVDKYTITAWVNPNLMQDGRFAEISI